MGEGGVSLSSRQRPEDKVLRETAVKKKATQNNKEKTTPRDDEKFKVIAKLEGKRNERRGNFNREKKLSKIGWLRPHGTGTRN